MKISIATSYYNRKQLFINTLKTIQLSAQKDIEVVVADDCSAPEHRLEDILEDYPFVKLIRLEPQDRWYTNPCVPFNKAINAATGDIVVIQNPECLHAGDILSAIVDRIDDKTYITHGVYSASQEITQYISELPFDNPHIFHMIKSQLQPIQNLGYNGEGTLCWYNHSIYRPDAYHFLSAMTRKNMIELGGFDERYANGIGFDDDEFRYRIRLKGLDVLINDNPFAVHQWHYTENNFFAKSPNPREAFQQNQNLFNNVTQKSTSWHVN